MTFDDVLPTLLRLCETWEHFGAIETLAVVRDLRGRIRLAVQPRSEAVLDMESLRALLTNELGDWFTGDLLSTRTGNEPVRNIARRVIAVSPAWDDARYPDVSGGKVEVTPGRWKRLERRVGKQPWLEGEATPPWPLTEADPTVVTFYSFKGGVGRTTTLAACALLAAQAGEAVVIVDLDLEAPGVASLFGIDDTSRGVLDVLVDHLAVDAVDLEGAVQAPRGLPAEYGDLIHVVPAGRLDRRYLEKLARLDFTGSTVDLTATTSPVRDALKAMLDRLRIEHRPKWIFLDARAGLHDLAGLSLHGLAHVDVIFSRANAQGLAGLDLVLDALSRAQRGGSAHTVLVHALAPVALPEAVAEQARMSERTHAMFVRHKLFPKGIPAQTAVDADHWPWTLHRDEKIERNDLGAVVPQLTSDYFRALWQRIRLLAVTMRGEP